MKALILAGLILALASAATLNYLLWTIPADTSPMTSSTDQGDAIDRDPMLDILLENGDATAVVHTFARPLFSSSRRPFVPPVASDQAPQVNQAGMAPLDQPPQTAEPVTFPLVTIRGIRMTPAEQAILLELQDSGTVEWFETGQSIEGWAIAAIDGDGAVLEHDGEKRRVNLYPSSEQ